MSMTIPKSLQSQQANRFQALSELSMRQWAFLELKEDPLFPYIKPERYGDYLDPALADGEEKARQYGTEEAKYWMKENGVALEVVSSGSPLLVHSETVVRNGKITVKIYEEVIRQLADCLKEKGIRLDLEELMTLHMAHEFYHCLEYRNQTDLSRKCPAVNYRFLGLIWRKGYVGRTREIGAHTYAGRVCGLPFHPKLLDYLLWEKQEPDSAAAYYRECMAGAEKWKGVL